MAGRGRVEIRGVSELQAGMRRLAGRIEKQARHEFARVADDTAGTVRSRVPRLTGALAASVEGREGPDGGTVGMGDGTRYAAFVEFGGRGHPASAQGNYLYPAAQAAQPDLVAAGERAATTEIGAMTWPSP